MRALLVGGGSFIGAYTIRRLLADGHRVVAYDLNVHDNAIHRILRPEELERVIFVQGDATDPVQLIRTASEQKVDSVVHLAAALIPLSDAQPALATRINCDGLNNSFETARILGLRRVVWASSIAVYGPPSVYGGLLPDEGSPHFPQTVYGACKSYCEYMGHHYHHRFGIDTVGLRFTVVYGHGRLRGDVAYQLGVELIEKPALGLPARVPVGDALVNWQHVEDAAQAVVLALYHEGTVSSRVYNTGGDVHTVREAAACVKRLLPEADIEVQPGEWGAIAHLSTRRAEEELGYRARFTLEDGLRDGINTLRRSKGLPEV